MSSKKETAPPDAANIVDSLSLKIPGSVSNLGPGFDALGLAINLYTRVNFVLYETKRNSEPIVSLKGDIAKKSQTKDQGVLIYHFLSELWQQDHDLLQRIRITVESNIPLGCGLGSSAAATLGALWASYHFKGLLPTRADILKEGTRLEGHPENWAASLIGNLVVCGRSADGESIVAEEVKWPERWKIIAVVPQYTLTTQEARAILPKRVDFDDAVANIQRTALIVAAAASVNEAVMKQALHDRLHEQYREKLVPELPHLRRHLAHHNIIGCVLAGGGSSTLVIVDQRHKHDVLADLKLWAQTWPSPPTILDLSVDTSGLQEVLP